MAKKKEKKKNKKRHANPGSAEAWANQFVVAGYLTPEPEIKDGWRMVRKGLEEWERGKGKMNEYANKAWKMKKKRRKKLWKEGRKAEKLGKKLMKRGYQHIKSGLKEIQRRS